MPKTVAVRGQDLEIDFNTGLEVSLEDPLFEAVYGRVELAIKGEDITPASITILATLCMQAVAKIPQLSGSQKKGFVINLIKKIVGDLENVSKTDRRTYQAVIDFTLPMMIDTLVDASKGKYDFKKASQNVRSLFSCCRKVE
jgi:hypothetical protein